MAEHELSLVEADPAQAGTPDGAPHWSCACGGWRWTLDPQGGPDRDGVEVYYQQHLSTSGAEPTP